MFFVEEILVFLTALLTFGFLMKWRRKDATSKYRTPPSFPSLPLVGSLPYITNVNDLPSFLKNKAEELGPIFTIRVFNRQVLILNSTDVIEKAFVRNSSVFSDRSEYILDKLINPENKGVEFKRKATEWKKLHQMTLSILKEFGFGVKSMMEERIAEEIEAVTEYVENKSGKSFDPKDMCILATSNIMMNILFGHRRDYAMGLSELFEQVHRYVVNFSNVCDIIPFMKYIPWFRQHMKDIADATRLIMKCFDIEIPRSIQDTAKPCFVQSFLQKVGPNLDEGDFRYTLRDLMAAGSDTTATTLSWYFLALANRLGVQKRMQAEIDSVIPADRLPSLQDEAKLPYVQATILEITRWRTLVPLAIPRETSRDSVVDGYFIPGGTMVFANLHAAHYDTSVWNDPEVFRPERFLDSENNVIRQDRIVPFSLGRRSCLGEILARAELFLIITSLVKRFVIFPEEGLDKLNEDPMLPISVVIFPNPYKIRLIQRK